MEGEAIASGKEQPTEAVDEADFPRLGALPRKVAVRKGSGGGGGKAWGAAATEAPKSEQPEEPAQVVESRQTEKEPTEEEGAAEQGESKAEAVEEEEEKEAGEEHEAVQEEREEEAEADGFKTPEEELKAEWQTPQGGAVAEGVAAEVPANAKPDDVPQQEREVGGRHAKPETGSVGSEESTEASREEVQDSGEEKLPKEEEPWGTPQRSPSARPWRQSNLEDITASPSEKGLTLAPKGRLNARSSLKGLEPPAAFGIKDMLRWRAQALAEGLHDKDVVYAAAATPAAPATSSGTGQGGRGERSITNGTEEEFPRVPRESSWRDDAARAQKESIGKAPRGDGGVAKPSRGPRRSEEAPAKPIKPLEISSTSWVAQQQARRKESAEDDVEVARSMKSILNKLTIEKFGPLYQQLIGCGIRRAEHVEILMREVFEKATTQHHFIGMYAELCAQLHKWFIENQVCGDDGKNFKRILLNRCQLSFEETLRPPQDMKDLDPERREEAEQLHKTRMLGNLRLVGALLEKGMLASRILVAVVDELLATPTSASLECLAVFLTAVGPTFDKPEWTYHMHLLAAFKKVRDLSKARDTPARLRFLLQDVLDLRASNWQNTKKAVPSNKGPTTLGDVHRQAEEELGERLTPLARPGGGSMSSSPPFKPCPPSPQAQACQAFRAPPQARLPPPEAAANSASPAVPAMPTAPTARFDREAFRNEDLPKLFAELRESLDVKAARGRLSAAAVPQEHQAAELTDLLVRIAEEGSAPVRLAGFKLVAELFLSSTWHRATLSGGLRKFFDDLYADLALDVPALPKIIKEELGPALAGLVAGGLLEADCRDRFLAAASAC